MQRSNRESKSEQGKPSESNGEQGRARQGKQDEVMARNRNGEEDRYKVRKSLKRIRFSNIP